MYNPDQTEQRKGRAWSAGSLRGIHLTDKYQCLKMQLTKILFEEFEFSASVTEYRREVLQCFAGELKPHGENSQGSKHHGCHASWSGNKVLA